MADATTVTGLPSSTADYAKRIQTAAAATRSSANQAGSAYSAAQNALENLQTEYGKSSPWGTAGGNAQENAQLDLGKALMSNYQMQAKANEAQAEKAAGALEMVGGATLAGMDRLSDIQSTIQRSVTDSSSAWTEAVEKADEYVTAARGRVSEVLQKLDDINKSIAKDQDFAKAHSMQAAVQATLGTMKAEERNIAENYGTNSKEYQQFQASKRTALATVQSNIQANYSALRGQQQQTYLSAVSDAYTKQNMYVGYQEQQHVDILKYRAQNEAANALQAAQMDASIEQIKMSGMENLANWIVQTPTFSMDATPLVAALADIGASLQSNQLAEQASSQQAALTNAQIKQLKQGTPGSWENPY